MLIILQYCTIFIYFIMVAFTRLQRTKYILLQETHRKFWLALKQVHLLEEKIRSTMKRYERAQIHPNRPFYANLLWGHLQLIMKIRHIYQIYATSKSAEASLLAYRLIGDADSDESLSDFDQ